MNVHASKMMGLNWFIVFVISLEIASWRGTGGSGSGRGKGMVVAQDVAAQGGQCYYPDGKLQTNPAFQPCNQFDGVTSQCCGTNHTGSVTVDRCLTNGLCQNAGSGGYWRLGCTDPTWKSPFCLRICLDEDEGGSSKSNVPVKACADGTWCCSLGSGNGNCCSFEERKFTLAATIGVNTTSTATSSVSSTLTTSSLSLTSGTDQATSSTLVSTTTGTDTTQSERDPLQPSSRPEDASTSGGGGLSTLAKIGLGVGIPLGIAFLAGICWLFSYLRKRDFQKLQKKMVETQSAGGQAGNAKGGAGVLVEEGIGEVTQVGEFERDVFHEMASKKDPVEVQAMERRFELGG